MDKRLRWLVVVLFAAAMAWVESAVVLYMRMLIEHLEPYRQGSVTAGLGLGQTELIREAATMVMLTAVGWLAGRGWRERLGYLLLAFGTWDILYYLFLIPLTGWPKSPVDWDLLFLIPFPWWGPVLAPLSLSAVLILLGALIMASHNRTRANWPGRFTWGLQLLGILLAVYVFMADSIQAERMGLPPNYYRPPDQFDWLLFLLALGLIASPAITMLRQLWRQEGERFGRRKTSSRGEMP